MKALRKRVLLKSPVREFRTPGSVRGLLGNRQSYRDQFGGRDASIEKVTLDVSLAQKKMLPCSFPKLVDLLIDAGT
jgi:hypothetical protein